MDCPKTFDQCHQSRTAGSVVCCFRNSKGAHTMSRWTKNLIVLILVSCFLGTEAQMLPNPYGAPISSEAAKKAGAAALAEAAKNHWTMAVAVVDPSGTLI